MDGSPRAAQDLYEAVKVLSAPLDLSELKKVVDRTWTDETPEQVIAIAANALFFAYKRIETAEAYDSLDT